MIVMTFYRGVGVISNSVIRGLWSLSWHQSDMLKGAGETDTGDALIFRALLEGSVGMCACVVFVE